MIRTSPRGLLVLVVAGSLLVVAGVALIASNAGRPAEFGWFGYAPDDLATPSLFVLTARELWGLALAALGLATVTAAAGYVIGARRTAAAGPPTAG